MEALRLQPEKYGDIPPVQVYFQIYKMLTGNDLGDYQAVLKVLQKNEKWLSKGALQNIYNYLQNYCIEQINKENRNF